MKDTYKETKQFTFPGMTINVYIPNLTESEKARRTERIKRAAISLLMNKEGN